MSSRWHDSDTVAQYVAGTLSPELLDGFEEHLLECDACRRDVRLGAAARIALREPSPAAAPAQRRRQPRVVGIVAALAAVLLVFVTTRRAVETRRLGAVIPPAFVATPLRAPTDSVALLVDRGMAAYAASDYADAATLLGRAAATDSSAAVAFYLGVALMLDGQADRAVAELLRATQPRTNPYASDATYFAAKALVRAHRADSARALLLSAVRDGARDARLGAFADSIARP